MGLKIQILFIYIYIYIYIVLLEMKKERRLTCYVAGIVYISDGLIEI